MAGRRSVPSVGTQGHNCSGQAGGVVPLVAALPVPTGRGRQEADRHVEGEAEAVAVAALGPLPLPSFQIGIEIHLVLNPVSRCGQQLRTISHVGEAFRRRML